MRVSRKVMAACIFSGQCANYGCLPLYHYETIFKCNGTKLYSPFYPSLQLRFSLLFGYISTCALLLLLIMYWLEIIGINSEFYSLFSPSINCPDLLTKPTLIQSSCSCKYPFMLFSLMIKKKRLWKRKRCGSARIPDHVTII